MIADFTEDQIRDFVIIWLEHGLQLQAEAQRKRLNPQGGACPVRNFFIVCHCVAARRERPKCFWSSLTLVRIWLDDNRAL
eukprot:COSAG01_NODE_395_length_17610_cov_20.238764_7_plen_80_part_00